MRNASLWWPGLSRKMITKQAIAMEAHPNIPNLARNRMAEIYQLGMLDHLRFGSDPNCPKSRGGLGNVGVPAGRSWP
jgi:hypothetical protein